MSERMLHIQFSKSSWISGASSWSIIKDAPLSLCFRTYFNAVILSVNRRITLFLRFPCGASLRRGSLLALGRLWSRTSPFLYNGLLSNLFLQPSEKKAFNAWITMARTGTTRGTVEASVCKDTDVTCVKTMKNSLEGALIPTLNWWFPSKSLLTQN
jgi:hypothetical protein